MDFCNICSDKIKEKEILSVEYCNCQLHKSCFFEKFSEQIDGEEWFCPSCKKSPIIEFSYYPLHSNEITVKKLSNKSTDNMNNKNIPEANYDQFNTNSEAKRRRAMKYENNEPYTETSELTTQTNENIEKSEMYDSEIIFSNIDSNQDDIGIVEDSVLNKEIDLNSYDISHTEISAITVETESKIENENNKEKRVNKNLYFIWLARVSTLFLLWVFLFWRKQSVEIEETKFDVWTAVPALESAILNVQNELENAKNGGLLEGFEENSLDFAVDQLIAGISNLEIAMNSKDKDDFAKGDIAQIKLLELVKTVLLNEALDLLDKVENYDLLQHETLIQSMQQIENIQTKNEIIEKIENYYFDFLETIAMIILYNFTLYFTISSLANDEFSSFGFHKALKYLIFLLLCGFYTLGTT